jgi:DNA-binding MarR family transcriptional regulator
MENAHVPADIDLVETELLLLARWLEANQRRARYPMDRAAYLLLRRLDADGPQRVAELAVALGLDGSTVTRQVTTLEDAGQVRRSAHPSDARATLVTATAAGRRAMEALRRHRQERIALLLHGWSPQERSELARVVGHLNAALRAHVARSDA